jgi:leucyl-tRNA synthetase
MEKRGHEVQIAVLPNPNDPKESEQVDYVLKNCALDANTVVVGHSLGAIVAMKALMKLDKPISGMLLVAPAVQPNFDKGTPKQPYQPNFTWDFDFERINRLAGSGKIAILADTQEKFRAPYLKYLSTQLKAGLFEVKAEKEHFCGKTEPMILKCCTPSVKVFTTRPDTLFGVTYIVLAPEHMWIQEFMDRLENRAEVQAYVDRAKSASAIDRTDATKEKTGVELKGIKAINPATGEEVPVWVSDYVLGDYGTGAVMAVPAHDDRDFAFAKKYKLPIKQVIVPEFGEKRPDETFRDGTCAIVFDPKSQKYAVTKDENGWYRLCSGGLDEGEKLEESVRREITEESGLHDFKSVQKIAEANAHYFNSLKKVNRAAHTTGYMVVLDSAATKATKLEAHEKFVLAWTSAEELLENWKQFRKDADHWAWLLGLAVGRLIESGIDTTSDPSKFKPMAYTGSGTLTNSKQFNGKPSESVMKEITEFAGGSWVAQYKLRDWVFSRQRYWGEPIPLIHCEKCGVVAVPEKDLPVKLPNVKSYEPTGTGESPLAAIEKWVNVKCPQCGGKGKRETNTMPQWAGSCWYYLRYEDPQNKRALVDPKKEKYWSPVDLYVGGAEHATRHLIYARFWHKFLYDIGAVSTIEPFMRLQSVGLIMGEDGRKMGKRFGNVVNPDDVVASYGADTMRIYEMFMGPFDQQITWSTSSMVGARRFIERVWKLAEKVATDAPGQRVIHKTVKKVTEDIPAMRFNTAISSMMICLNELEKAPQDSRADYEAFLKLLAPFAPHVTEELWRALGNKGSIHISEWPSHDEKLTIDDTATIILQVNGKVRGSFTSPLGASKEALETMAKSLPEAQKWLNGNTVKRVIVVPDKLVNIVV